MTAEYVTKKVDLIAHIERDWAAINALLNSLSETQLTDIRNADGWAIKDHIAHLTAWEQGVIAFLTGIPRHQGLGVPEEVYLSDDVDVINAAIFKNRKDLSLDEVQQAFQSKHQQLMQLVEPLTDEDLAKPYSHYLPDEPGEGDGPPAINIIYGNTANHFREHQAWIEEMLT